MRHVSKCRLCYKCHLSETPPPGYEPAMDTGDGEANGLSSTRRLFSTDGDGSGATSGGAGTSKAPPTRRKKGPVYDAELDPTVPIQYKPSSYQVCMSAAGRLALRLQAASGYSHWFGLCFLTC